MDMTGSAAPTGRKEELSLGSLALPLWRWLMVMTGRMEPTSASAQTRSARAMSNQTAGTKSARPARAPFRRHADDLACLRLRMTLATVAGEKKSQACPVSCGGATGSGGA